MMTDALLWILGIFGALYFLTVIGHPFYYRYGTFKWFYHDIMCWHRPDDSPKTFDGCSVHVTCKYCGKDIMQDSQGNWF
jgi:hypothetical protein